MVIPFTSKLEKGKSVLMPVSGNDIYRSSGQFYIQFKHDPVHNQFIISEDDISRIADVWGLDIVTDNARVRGRITELLVLRDIFDILWPYRIYFDTIAHTRSKVNNLVMVSFHDTNHFLFDIYIPFMDLFIDCKNRWSPETVYPSQVRKLNSSQFPNNAFVRPEDFENLVDLHRLYPDFPLGYLTANFAIPDKYDFLGNNRPICATLLQTSIKMHSFTLSKDVLINVSSLENKVPIPTKTSISYNNFLELIRTELKKYLDTKSANHKNCVEVTKNVKEEKELLRAIL